MSELEPLAALLKNELGMPPDPWQQAQRARFRQALERGAERRPGLRYLALAATLFAVVTGLAWVSSREGGSHEVARRLDGREQRAPFRFDDGSSITLDSSSRGVLVSDPAFVRFELESGRANFDVTPGQKRTWTIVAGKNEVRVIGTRFSVSYAPSQAFEVGVERGVVSVRVAERNASVELRAGDHLRGGPGRMEVLHDSLQTAPAAASAEAVAPDTQPSASTFPRLEPARESAGSDEWRERYRRGKYAESLALLRASGVAERLEELGPGTLAEVADAARLGGDSGLAARALSALMRRFPRAPEARDGKFLLGRVHAVRGDTSAAIAAFEGYLKPGGSTRYANEAMGRLLELYAARNEHERARAMAERYLESAPEGPYRRLARSLAGRQK
jgi:transmembrane sensor